MESRHNYMSKYIPLLLFLVSDTEVGLAFAALWAHQGSAGSSPDQRQPPHTSKCAYSSTMERAGC